MWGEKKSYEQYTITNLNDILKNFPTEHVRMSSFKY